MALGFTFSKGRFEGMNRSRREVIYRTISCFLLAHYGFLPVSFVDCRSSYRLAGMRNVDAKVPQPPPSSHPLFRIIHNSSHYYCAYLPYPSTALPMPACPCIRLKRRKSTRALPCLDFTTSIHPRAKGIPKFPEGATTIVTNPETRKGKHQLSFVPNNRPFLKHLAGWR